MGEAFGRCVEQTLRFEDLSDAARKASAQHFLDDEDAARRGDDDDAAPRAEAAHVRAEGEAVPRRRERAPTRRAQAPRPTTVFGIPLVFESGFKTVSGFERSRVF